MDQKKYTIKELSELTGYPLRTIRYYVQEGLLEPPAGRGRGGFYYDSHLSRLRQIKAWQEKGTRIASIKEYLKGVEEPLEECSRDIWVKYEIIPGLEISVKRNLEEKNVKGVFEIIRIAKSIAREM
jgi:DNA-binding transcriptional MerR regulator